MAIPSKTPRKRVKSTNGCFITTILLVILVAVSVAATFYFLFLRSAPVVAPTAAKPAAAQVKVSPSPPAPASAQPAKKDTPAATDEPVASPVLDPPGLSPEPAANTPVEAPPKSQGGNKVAIIVDDIGNTKKAAEEIIALDLTLALSILPHTPHANHLASLGKARGHEILLHLPMEASDPKWAPGPGTLLLAMSKEELIATIHQDLDTPYRVIGINNHMGSKFSEDPVAMRIFLNTIKAQHLFFIDSLTSINSVGYTMARDLGLKTAKRDIFLDNEQEPTKILAQIGKLIALAQKNGSAIGICHPHPATVEALRSAQARLRLETTMVPIHELVF